ncbi:hypothetical protein JTB14_009063 [Gonioctena quinquepunctata]|nr:hypothetical protein JTB14_009063 [Gonioctena quinquepunctata]
MAEQIVRAGCKLRKSPYLTAVARISSQLLTRSVERSNRPPASLFGDSYPAAKKIEQEMVEGKFMLKSFAGVAGRSKRM